MIRKREVPLKIELLADGEDSQFSIHSKREIQSILNGIVREGSRAALYYDDGNDFILTTALKISEQGLWLDVGPIATSNQRIQHSKKIIFISSHHQVKIQFTANRIENAILGTRAAFYLPLPATLLRIQRREYFRLTTFASNPLRCVIPVSSSAAHAKRTVTIMDISGGGVALVCETRDTELLPGNIYYDCSISLPDVGTISVTIIVKNAFEVTLRNGDVCKRAGCEFSCLSGEAAALLQRYVVHLQSETLIKSA